MGPHELAQPGSVQQYAVIPSSSTTTSTTNISINIMIVDVVTFVIAPPNLYMILVYEEHKPVIDAYS